MATNLEFGHWHIVPGPRAPQRSLKPVGVCIYCSTTSKPLEDEHIIPDGIGGDLILPKASCRPCAEKINDWEQRVQKRNLGATREVAGLKSRKRRGRRPAGKKHYRAVAASIADGEDPRDAVRGPLVTDPNDLPRMVLAETTLGPPEFIGGPIAGNGIRLAMSALREGGLKEVSVDFWAKGGDYLRLIAKIAHGFTAATVGPDGFTPFLTDIVLGHGHPDSDLWKYIGGEVVGRATQELHGVRLTTAVRGIRSETGLGVTMSTIVVAHVRLFANYGAPLYQVVVGTLKGGPPKLVI